jgi:hypothetical protein
MATEETPAKPERVELFDKTLGVVIQTYPTREDGNAAKAIAPDGHDLTVRKVRDDAST